MLIGIAGIAFLVIAAYIALQHPAVQRYLTQRIANVFAEQLNTQFYVGGVDIALFDKIILEDVWMEDTGQDTLVYIKKLTAGIDSFSIKKRHVTFRNIDLDHALVNLSVDSTGAWNYRIPEKSNTQRSSDSTGWNLACTRFTLKQSEVNLGAGTINQPRPQSFTDINSTLTNFRYRGDSLALDLENLSFESSVNLDVKNLSAELSVHRNETTIRKINLETSRSQVTNTSLTLHPTDTLQPPGIPGINFFVGQSSVNMEDIAVFIPGLKGMDDPFEFSGHIFGDLTSLKGNDISLKTGNYTSVNCNFYLNGLSEGLDDLYLFIDLTDLQTTFADLSKINLPRSSKIKHIAFPEFFYDAGIITYQGNFTGFLTDFVAFGRLNSDMGNISTDLSFAPGEKGIIELDGKISTTGFMLGALFNNDNLGNVSFDGIVNGEYHKETNDIRGTFEGGIASIEARGYTYRNFLIDGKFENKNFDGFVNIDDPNLKLDFLGKLHLNPEIPEFDFDLSVRHANLRALKIDSLHELSDLAFISKANFTGNSIDNLNGFIRIENGSYLNTNGELTFQDMGINTRTHENNRVLSFASDFLDIEIDGQYNLRTFPATFRYIVSQYLPALAYSDEKDLFSITNRFKIQAEIKDLDKITAVFQPELKIITPFTIEGEIDTGENLFYLNSTIPGASSKNLILRDISIRSETNKVYNATLKIGQLQTRSGIDLYNIALNAEARENLLNTRLTWNNYHPVSYSGEVNTTSKLSGKGENIHAEIDIIPSDIYISDSLLQVSPGRITIDSSRFCFEGVGLTGSSQTISVNGIISENPKDRLKILFSNINLSLIEKYFQSEATVNGIGNGSIELEDLYGNRLIYSDLILDHFRFKDQTFGNISLSNSWDSHSGKVLAEMKISDKDITRLYASGFYNPLTDSLSLNADLNEVSLVILEQVIRKTFSDFQGVASGSLNIHGTPDNILLDGTLMGTGAGLTIDFTQVPYTFNDSVYFLGNQILFNHLTIYDELGNQGIFHGTLTHTNFSNMVYDLSVTSPEILAMNTGLGDNSQFFGRVIANGSFYITGQGVNVTLDGEGSTLRGTNVSISLGKGQEAEQYDFIEFIGSETREDEKEKITYISKQDTSLNLNLRIEVTPEAQAQLIYNSQVGDIIRGQGEGVLQIGMDQNGDLTILGSYNIVQGDYLFTLKNVLNKRFTIEPGSSVNFPGDPMNANIDIEAVYRLKASLYELFANSNLNVDRSQRIPVECKILLSDNLSNPDIHFDIEFPLVETRLVDELQQFFNTEEEMNRQIISLVVLGQFYTPEFMRGTYEAATTSSYAIGSTASEVFSNQFSNWLSQISNDFDIGFNYRPGTQLTKDEIELALSKQMFNDRVTINGNIANNVNPTATNNSQIVGDFDLKVNLTDNGKIQLKAFNRSNNNLIYETAPYTQGIGLIFREEYNNLGELLNKLLSLFGK